MRLREGCVRILIKSFGFEYGEPYPEANLQFDLRRRIQNPHDQLVAFAGMVMNLP